MIELLLIVPLLGTFLSILFPLKKVYTLPLWIATLHLFLTIINFIITCNPNLALIAEIFPGQLSGTQIQLVFFFKGYITFDGVSRVIILLTSFLFFSVSLYLYDYFKYSQIKNERSFIFFYLIFFFSMNVVILADHLILFWSAIELSTLVTAPLVLTFKTKKAVEATWRYILLCSIGIAFALIGVFFLVISLNNPSGVIAEHLSILSISNLTFSRLYLVANKLDVVWVKASFILFLIGYGTKMGIAPMHTWLADTYSEAPTPVSALLAGALTNCAYLGIYKSHQILIYANAGEFSSTLLKIYGLLSMFVAAIFILRQKDIKRMLGYSSMENIGIVCVGTAIGGVAQYAALLQVIYHSLIKSSLFLSVGNIILLYKTKENHKIFELTKKMPKSFMLFFIGIIGLIGLPPMGTFFSKMILIFESFLQKDFLTMIFFLIFVIIVGCSLITHLIRISFSKQEIDIGESRDNRESSESKNVGEENFDSRFFVWPQYLLLISSIILTFWIPATLYNLIKH
ncbi:MAG: hydrogenase [Oligoflexia bacterium]|nr:hydrogenase [Oligoflexia bacterium]